MLKRNEQITKHDTRRMVFASQYFGYESSCNPGRLWGFDEGWDG